MIPLTIGQTSAMAIAHDELKLSKQRLHGYEYDYMKVYEQQNSLSNFVNTRIAMLVIITSIFGVCFLYFLTQYRKE